jgi:hypothetical protein
MMSKIFEKFSLFLLYPINYIYKNNQRRVYSVTKEKETEKLEDVMRDLEKKVNPKSMSEGLSTLNTAIQKNDSSILLSSMQDGAKEFEERVGRPMTYGEMRAMWG